MILEALCGYYDRLSKDPDSHIPAFGYAETNVAGVLVLNATGELVGFVPLSEGKKKFKSISTPIRPKVTSGIKAGFLCDKADYFLGLHEKHGAAMLEASRKLHHEILDGVDDPGAQAVLAFLDAARPNDLSGYKIDLSDLPTGVYVFRLEHQPGYIHDSLAIANAWFSYREMQSKDATQAQCLVTGKTLGIARLHDGIPGFGKDKPTMVGFNQDSFVSYRKEQGENAPVSELAAFQYVTALGQLMTKGRHSVRLGSDTTVAFWAERKADTQENMLAELFGSAPEEETEEGELQPDSLSEDQISNLLQSVYVGKRPADTGLDESVRFYLLGLSANRTRMVLRFFYTDTFGQILDRFVQHYDDIAIIAAPWDKPRISPKDILLECAVEHKYDNIPPTLEGALMRSILWGTAYPYGLYTAILGRIRAEAGRENKQAINRTRVGVIKGFLNRNARLQNIKEMMTVALNPEETNHAYLLGRMMAVMEKTQRDALGGNINASVVDKYLNAALAAPRNVYPTLLTLFEKHVDKAEQFYNKQLMAQIIDLFDSSGFPETLNAEDQGRYLIGYYHQRQQLYTKKSNEEQTENGGQE